MNPLLRSSVEEVEKFAVAALLVVVAAFVLGCLFATAVWVVMT